MTPKEKAQQLFDEKELFLLKDDKWITVQRVKDRVVMDLETIINTYRNSSLFEREDNQNRIDYWINVKQELKYLFL